MREIKCIGNRLECKLYATIRFHFENGNGLPISKSEYHSVKVSCLRHVWSKFNVDFMLLVETQINPSLLHNKDSLHASIFQNYEATSMFSSNTNELISRRKQVGAMTIVKSDIAKHATSTGANATCLGR